MPVYTFTVRMMQVLCVIFHEANIPLTGALTNPAPGVLDFDAWRALQPIYDAAKQAGIFITLRPGT